MASLISLKQSAHGPGGGALDRILNEVIATGDDIKRICVLFGLTVGGASRYIDTLEHPDLR